jgi:predicted RNA-binding Zn-ribbon protein involved in translation (DUF1610 family)
MISNISKAKAQVDRQCPKCGSTDIIRSQRVDFTEQIMAFINIYPYRCQKHNCKQRFESFGRR